MNTEATAYFEAVEDTGAAATFRATWHTAGPWTEDSQHGSPPAALLARELERRVVPAGKRVSRFTMDLLGPIPVAEVVVRAEVLRDGRAVALVRAELADPATGRTVAQASAWCVPILDGGPEAGAASPPGTPADGIHHPMPPGWVRGYADSIDWRWVEGSVAQAGPATVWMRPRVPLIDGEALSPLQRVLACVDSASGIGAELDLRAWDFRNTDLTVHIVRPPAGEWVALAASTLLAGTGAGLARATLYDERGVIGASAQALLVRPRTR